MLQKFIVRYRFLIFFTAIAITILSLTRFIPVKKLKFDFSFKRLLFKEGVETESILELKKNFGEDSGLIVIFLSLPENGNKDYVGGTVFEPQYLKILNEIFLKLKARVEIEKSQVYSILNAVNLHSNPIEVNPVQKILKEIEDFEKINGKITSDEIIKFDTGRKDKIRKGVVPLLEKLKALKIALLNHKTYKGRILSEDAKSSAIIAKFTLSHRELKEREPACIFAMNLLQEKQRGLKKGEKLYITGVPPIEVEYKRLSYHDLTLFTPVVGGITILILFALFRSISLTLIPVIITFLCVIWTVGFMQWIGEPINILNNVIPVIILVLGISDSVHFLSRYREELNKEPEKLNAVQKTVGAMMVALFLTSITNAVGFFSLITAYIPSIRYFGIYTSTACMFVYLALIFGIGSTIGIFPKPYGKKGINYKKGGRIIQLITKIAVEKPFIVFIIFIIIILLSLILAFNIKIESKLLEELKKDNPFYIATKKFEEKIGGVINYEILIKGNEYKNDKCRNDEDCRKKDCEKCPYPDCCETMVCVKEEKLEKKTSEETIEFIDEDEEVNDSVISYGYCAESVKTLPFLSSLSRIKEKLYKDERFKGYIKNIHILSDIVMEMNRGIGDDYALPKTGKRAISQLLLPLEGDGSETLRRYVNPSYTKTHISIETGDEGSSKWLMLKKNINKLLSEEFIENPSFKNKFKYEITGTMDHAEESIQNIIRDIIFSVLSAFVIISFLIALIFRSFKIGLILMIPNVIPLIMTLGFMVVTGIEIRTATAVIFAISLGIAVNDTIHFFARFKEEIQGGLTLKDAVVKSLRTTGRAMVLSTIVLISGFGINLISDFVATQQFGILASFTVFSALIADLILTPSLIIIFKLDRAIKR